MAGAAGSGDPRRTPPAAHEKSEIGRVGQTPTPDFFSAPLANGCFAVFALAITSFTLGFLASARWIDSLVAW